MDYNKIRKILINIPLRISITDYCNLNCFFCSNEGMDLGFKNTSEVDFEKLLELLKLLKKNGLEKVSITGGEPTCYSQLEELLMEINELKFKEAFFHTNGAYLYKDLILGELKNFDKVAISIHSLNFEEWKKMTGGQKRQYDEILHNLKLIHKEGYDNKIEIKITLVKGINNSKESIKKILDFCDRNNFRFKFLVLDPIKAEHRSLVVPQNKISDILESLGAEYQTKEKTFRGQVNYLPIKRYVYETTKGVLVEIGCGKKEVCMVCSGSNEIIITSNLMIKPCRISSHTINIRNAISHQEEDKVLNLLLGSRCFLDTSPGKNKQFWSQD